MTDSRIPSLISRAHWPLLELEMRWVYRDVIQKKHVGNWWYNPHASAWLVLRGWSRVKNKKGAAEARAGEWLVAPPGERLQHASGDCEHLSIAFVARWVFGRELFPLGQPLVFPGKEHPSLRVLGLRLAADAARHFPRARHELPWHSGTLRAHLRLTAGFYAWFEVLAEVLEKKGIQPDLGSIDPRVGESVRSLDRVRDRLPEPDELARQAGISASQLNRLFRRELGVTVREYCQRRRLVLARTLLAASGSRVKETAFRLGFLSSQHFSRWFHHGTGMTPTQYQTGGGAAW